jgi:hypothetical protein
MQEAQLVIEQLIWLTSHLKMFFENNKDTL